MDLFASGYMETFVRAAAEREVNTIAFLCKANRLALLLDLVQEVLREKSVPEWEDFRNAIRDVTAKWNGRNLKRYMDLMPLVPKALKVILDAIERMDVYFVKSNIVNFKPGSDPDVPQAAFITEGQAVAYIHPWTPGRALEIMLHLAKEHGEFIDVLPATFALQLYEYCKGSGAFHKYVKSCFKMETMTGHMERPNISMERGELLDQYSNFIAAGKVESDNGLVFGCNIRSGFAVAKAMSLVRSRQNASRRNKFLKLLLQSDQQVFALEN